MTVAEKILPLEDVSKILTAAKKKHKKIAQCHGVYDLMHIGHIRHFAEAKKMADILVVTVTPDRFVNKGPHRPVFGEGLRAEAIAALDAVDFVAVNHWPTAVESIALLQPDFYVKGADYREGLKDITGGIGLEKTAVQQCGGELIFTDELTFSSSKLINDNLSTFPPEVCHYLKAFKQHYRYEDIIAYLDRAQKLKVLVVGEAIIDEYDYCQSIGKSSKEPIVAVRYVSKERFAGGTLAIANHLAEFCDSVSLLTFLGDRHSEETFIQSQLHPNINPLFLTRNDSPTIVKRRFLDDYFYQKLLEVYEMNDGLLAQADNRALCDTLKKELPKYDLVISADFGHGMMTSQAIEMLCKRAPFLAVNTQSNAGNLGYHTISRYPRADYICIAHNETLLEQKDRNCDLISAAKSITGKLSCPQMTITRGKQGCFCYQTDGTHVETPAFAGKVVDRIGAGDAVLSLTSLCAVQHAPAAVLGFLGNAVGAQAVATVCNREPVGKVALYKHIECLLK